MAEKKHEPRTAHDVMNKHVVAVHPEDTLQDAMNTMTEYHVTGLPVMDSKSRCVGMISATDILNYEQEHSEFVAEANSDLARHYDADTGRWESVRVTTFALEEFAEVKVEEVMTRELISVSPDTPVREVAEIMVKNEIHRVLVLNEKQNLYGIISSMDFVRMYAEA